MSTSPAQRMRALRNRRRACSDRETRMAVPDARSDNVREDNVRERVAQSVARLDPAQEAHALAWIEAVADFDEHQAR